MAGMLTNLHPHGIRTLVGRERSRRQARIEARIRRRRARRDVEPRSGEVRLGQHGPERLQHELAAHLIAWSRRRSIRLIDVMIPPVEARPGERFVAPARDADGRVLFLHCLVAGRARWRRGTVTVRFNVLEGHSPAAQGNSE